MINSHQLSYQYVCAILIEFLGANEAFRYTVYLSDECILAPMAFFHTELLELTRSSASNGVRFMGVNPGDPEDPHDNIYLSETSRKYTKVYVHSVHICILQRHFSFRLETLLGLVILKTTQTARKLLMRSWTFSMKARTLTKNLVSLPVSAMSALC